MNKIKQKIMDKVSENSDDLRGIALGLFILILMAVVGEKINTYLEN